MIHPTNRLERIKINKKYAEKAKKKFIRRRLVNSLKEEETQNDLSTYRNGNPSPDY